MDQIELKLWDDYAARAMQSGMANSSIVSYLDKKGGTFTEQHLVTAAFDLADHMIAERRKRLADNK